MALQGSLISSVLIFLVLFVGYVWEQVRLYWAMRQAELRHEQAQPAQPRPPQVTVFIPCYQQHATQSLLNTAP